jgi:hypothetical protein
MGFELVTGFIGHLQIVIKIHHGAAAIAHTLQFTRLSTESSQPAFSMLILWHQLPTTDFLLPLNSRTISFPQPQQLSTHTELNCNSTPNPTTDSHLQ